jgi:hydrophobic/amphiphilic exporter-1 (mainly G- bacteria), HAE1 family
MSKFFINRPVTAIVISILIVLAGIIMALRLPIAQFPSIAPPEIVVTTNYVGADALTIESSVATPIEEAMAGVEGMLYMRSFNANDGTMTHLLHHASGSCPFPRSCNFENGLVTRLLSR